MVCSRNLHKNFNREKSLTSRLAMIGIGLNSKCLYFPFLLAKGSVRYGVTLVLDNGIFGVRKSNWTFAFFCHF